MASCLIYELSSSRPRPSSTNLEDMSSFTEVKIKKREAAKAVDIDTESVQPDAQQALQAEEAEVKKSDHAAEPEEEVEVLSHAEQRKRRKLEKQKARSGRSGDGVEVDGAEASKSEESSSKAAAAEPPRQSKSTYGIWVGNLAFKTDADKVSFSSSSYFLLYFQIRKY